MFTSVSVMCVCFFFFFTRLCFCEVSDGLRNCEIKSIRYHSRQVLTGIYYDACVAHCLFSLESARSLFQGISLSLYYCLFPALSVPSMSFFFFLLLSFSSFLFLRPLGKSVIQKKLTQIQSESLSPTHGGYTVLDALLKQT